MNSTVSDLRDRCRLVDGHWLWAGALSDGYPRIWAPEHTTRGGGLVTQTGRRAMWHVKTGQAIPTGWRVFGTCGERTCIAPDHMVCRPVAEQGAVVAQKGSLKGNVRRIVANRASGRQRSKLTPELIALIHASDKTGLQLARELQVAPQTISKARQGKALAFEPVGGLFTGLLAAPHRRTECA